MTDGKDERTNLAGVQEAWAREIKQRMREVESGAVKTIPWPEVRKRIQGLRDARTKS